MNILAVLGLFSAFFVGFCSGQTESFFNYDESVKCGIDSFCVPITLCRNKRIVEDGSLLVVPRTMCSEGQECCKLGPSCGLRNIKGLNPNERNRSGRAKFGEFPWTLIVSGVASNKLYGGASLIHPKIALTSAHNVHKLKVDELKVIAGKWSLGRANDNEFPHQERTVSEKVQHERYNDRSLHFDISLLFLSRPFDLEKHIGTVCLPPPNFDTNLVTCYVTGWGEETIEPPFPSALKRIDLPTETHAACQNLLRQTVLSRVFKLHESFMCAGGEADKDACIDDGGSPLVCPIAGMNSRYYQAGIVSWGIDCGRENVPGVYASIPYLRSWVDQKLAERDIDNGSYTYTTE